MVVEDVVCGEKAENRKICQGCEGVGEREVKVEMYVRGGAAGREYVGVSTESEETRVAEDNGSVWLYL